MSLLSRGTDTFYAFRFLRLLTTPWEETGAFKAGLIDKDGKVLRKAELSADRDVYNIFHKLVFNVKRLMNKLPFGKTTIASYITALYLIKEHGQMEDVDLQNVLSEAGLDCDFEFALLESKILSAGTYTLTRDIALPQTGEILALAGSSVVLENTDPHGSLFGTAVFKVKHVPSKVNIFVNSSDLL